MTKADRKIIVTRRAALARVRREMAKEDAGDGWTLRTARSDAAALRIGGRYWAVKRAGTHPTVCRVWFDLAQLLAWWKALEPWEALETSD